MSGSTKFSSALMGLKFMKKAIEKDKSDREKEQENKKEVDEREEGQLPVEEEEEGPGCVVSMEGDPPPSALLGRFSCNRKNPDIERLARKLMEMKEENATREEAKDDGHAEVAVTDKDMASTLGRKRKELPYEDHHPAKKVFDKA